MTDHEPDPTPRPVPPAPMVAAALLFAGATGSTTAAVTTEHPWLAVACLAASALFVGGFMALIHSAFHAGQADAASHLQHALVGFIENVPPTTVTAVQQDPAPVAANAGAALRNLADACWRIATDEAAHAVEFPSGRVVFYEDALRILDSAQTDAYADGRQDQHEEDTAELARAWRLSPVGYVDEDEDEDDDPEQDDAEREALHAMQLRTEAFTDDSPDMARLIERSTLGAPKAAALRASTPPEVRAEILAGVAGPGPVDTAGVLAAMDIATAAGDRDLAIEILDRALRRAHEGEGSGA